MSDQPTLLITGASRGLGAAAARIAASQGANVVLAARSGDDLAGVAHAIRAVGGHALAVESDVSQREDTLQLVEKALERFGRIDALINNAGIIEPIAPLAEAPPERWAHNLAVNVVGPFLLIQAALPALRAAQGRVINVSSGAAVGAIPGWSAYCASKAALNHLTAVLAVEEPTIVAIAVRPGVVDTEMQSKIRRDGATGMPAETHRRFVAQHEAGTLLPPEEPARALVALARHAPRAWSGEFLTWDDARVAALPAL